MSSVFELFAVCTVWVDSALQQLLGLVVCSFSCSCRVEARLEKFLCSLLLVLESVGNPGLVCVQSLMFVLFGSSFVGNCSPEPEQEQYLEQ